jgi:hypothetical protein
MADEHEHEHAHIHEANRKALAEDKARREAAAKEADQSKGRPTPTQEENDMARLGIPHEKQPDGSPPDPYATRALETDTPAGYQNRQAAARHAKR